MLAEITTSKPLGEALSSPIFNHSKIKTMKQQTQTPDTTKQSYVEPVGFTEGIWKVDPILGGTFGYEVVDNNGNTIADCYKNSYYRNRPNGREIGQANARRIVECVTKHDALVAALKEAVSVIKAWHNADDVWNIYFNNAPEMKAIKKAMQEAGLTNE